MFRLVTNFSRQKTVVEAMTVRYKGMMKHAVSGNKEFDCDRCISVARDFLLIYLNEHLPEKK